MYDCMRSVAIFMVLSEHSGIYSLFSLSDFVTKYAWHDLNHWIGVRISIILYFSEHLKESTPISGEVTC